MLSKVMWFLILLISTTTLAVVSAISTAPPPPSPLSTTSSAPPPTPSYAFKTAPPVFTADSVRHTTQGPPPTATLARRQGKAYAHTHKQPNYYEVDAGIDAAGVSGLPTLASIENNYNDDLYTLEHRGQPDDEDKTDNNVGFVPSVDFKSILSDLDKFSGGDGRKGAGDVLTNPFAPEARKKDRDSFPYFFGEERAAKENVFEPNFGSLASSASDQKTRKVKDDDEEGFVDPNVQFRSLFESAETADGFRPTDFLEYKEEPAVADLSKSSQSRAYPQYTYTGRDGDDSDGDEEEDEVYRELEEKPARSPDRYRSSYRQVDSRNRNRDPYDDRNYYDGERDTSPAAPAPPAAKYRVGSGTKAAAATEEPAHSPQSSGSSSGGGSKSESPGKNKCKKVEKLVEENEEYDSYLEPEEGYDPSTYSSRYKRQAGGRGQARGNKGSSNKKPMTCYVCEDEEGRYAERCSYDSKADPKAGSYFHSSSTSFNDNGRNGGKGGNKGQRGRRGGDRYKRDPEHSDPSSPLEAQASASPAFNLEQDNGTSSEEHDLPKKLHKRQSSGSRYASGYPRNPNANNRQLQGQQGNNRRQQEYEDGDEEDYESPYAPYASDAGRDEYGFSPSSRGGRRGSDRTRGRNEFDISIPTPDYRQDPGRGRGDHEREEDYDHDDFDYEPPAAREGGRNHNRGSRGGERSSNPEHDDFDIGPGPSYGGSDNRRAGAGSGSGGRRGGNGSGGGLHEFAFGAPADFGRDQGENSRGFNVDFSIPRDFDPDVQLGASNSNNRPIFSNNNEFDPDFDREYEEHVKQHFPEAFGSGSSTAGPGAQRGHSPQSHSSTYRPYNGPAGPYPGQGGPGPHSSPSGPGPRPVRPAPVYRGRSPTQQRHQYSPPPYFNGPNRGNGNGNHFGGPHDQQDDIAHNDDGGQLHQAINSFQQKGLRPGCQRVQKGDMTCVVCSDPRGMKKEECMYANNDPKNHQMAYHEVSSYSSPGASILPSPKSSKNNKNQNQHVESTKIVHQESKKVEVRKLPKTKSPKAAKSDGGGDKKSIFDYDFDY